MTSTVSPPGSGPSGRRPGSPGVRPSVRGDRIRRIAEEEYILVVLLAGFGLIFLLIFPPALVVNDSWLNLMAGREVVENGLPSRDEITVYGLGATWTDQQWLAQVFMYGVYSLGGFALLSVARRPSSSAPSRSPRGRAPARCRRARDLGDVPAVLVAAPWAWSIRAQMLALPLYTACSGSSRRRRAPDERIWLALPLLVVWANVHGSVAPRRAPRDAPRRLRADPQPRATWMRSVALLVLAPLAVLATPYGPSTTRALLPPPARRSAVRRPRHRVALGGPAAKTMASTSSPRSRSSSVWLGPRRLTAFDIAVLALTFAEASTRSAGSSGSPSPAWSSSRSRSGTGSRARALRRAARGLNVGDRGRADRRAARGRRARSSSATRTWFEEYWPREAVEAVRARARAGRPRLRARPLLRLDALQDPRAARRIAYDVRFEIYDREFFDRLQDYDFEDGTDWKSFADGYRIVIVDETTQSHTADFLAEPARASSTATTRSRSSCDPDDPTSPARRVGTRPRPRARTPSPSWIALEPAANARTTFGRPREERRVGVTTHGSPRSTRPTSPVRRSGAV